MTDEMPVEKRCIRCEEVKPIEEFHKNKKQKDGCHYYCKKCIAAYQSANKNRIRERQRAYWAEHADKKREYNRAYQAANVERIRELKSKYRIEHADEIREYNRAYYAAHAEEIAARVRAHRRSPDVRQRLKAWRIANADKLRELNRGYHSDPSTLEYRRVQRQAYTKANPDIYRAAKQRRRALIMGNGGTFTSKELKTMRAAQAGVCAYCKQQHDPNELAIDHIVPLKQGGRHEASNICLACPKCNASKNNRTPEQWVNRWYLRKRIDD